MKKSSDHRWCEQKKSFYSEYFLFIIVTRSTFSIPAQQTWRSSKTFFNTKNIAFNHGIMLEFCEVEGRVT